MNLADHKKQKAKKIAITTLAFLVKDNALLLAMKKRGLGVGKWNGVGGKLDKGESVEEAAKREMQEEIGVTPLTLDKRAELYFYHPVQDNGSDYNQKVVVYFVKDWEGEPQESEEMRPRWFSFEQIPYQEMWPDDKEWLPLVLAGKKVEGHFLFDADFSIVEHEVGELEIASSV